MMPNHPRTNLFFYVAGEVDDNIRERVRLALVRLKDSRPWVIAPPTFLNQVDKAKAAGDSDVEIVGGVLDLYSAMAPERLPASIDRLHFEEVLSTVEVVSELSKYLGVPFEFQLEGSYAGCIEDGVPDRTLQVGLIDEWRRHLGAASAG